MQETSQHAIISHKIKPTTLHTHPIHPLAESRRTLSIDATKGSFCNQMDYITTMPSAIAIPIETPDSSPDDSNNFRITNNSYMKSQVRKFQLGVEYIDLLSTWLDNTASPEECVHLASQEFEDRRNEVSLVDSSLSFCLDVDFGMVDSLTLIDNKQLAQRIFDNVDQGNKYDMQDSEYSDTENLKMRGRCHRRNGVRRGQPQCILDSLTRSVRTKLG